jgi:GTPase SAR1 family protein
MLLGNKCDLPNKVVTHEMGQEFAKSHGMGFMEVSAKSDIGIKAAFSSLSTAIYQQKSGATPAQAEDRG